MSDIPLIVRLGLSIGSFSVAIGVCLLMISLWPWLQKSTVDKLIKCGSIMLIAPISAVLVFLFASTGIALLR